MKKTFMFIALATLLGLSLMACGPTHQAAPQPAPVVAAAAPAAPAKLVFNTIDEYKAYPKEQAPKTDRADEAKALIEQGKFKAIIDVREPGELADGHLPGAVNIPRGLVEFKIGATLPDLPKDAPILVYCKEGPRGALSAAALAMIGYTDVTNIAGGYLEWAEKGLPSTKDPI